MCQVDRLEMSVSLGDYSYIYTVKDPKVVAFYLKSILKYMDEPLCTFTHYSKFKYLCEQLNTNNKIEINHLIDSLKEIFQAMDPVYLATWRLIAQLFLMLSQYSEYNKVRVRYS